MIQQSSNNKFTIGIDLGDGKVRTITIPADYYFLNIEESAYEFYNDDPRNDSNETPDSNDSLLVTVPFDRVLYIMLNEAGCTIS